MLARVLWGWAGATTLASCVVYANAALDDVPPSDAPVVVTTWSGGKPVARALERGTVSPPEDPRVVREVVTGRAFLPNEPHLLALAILPGLEGVHAKLDGKEAWLTADDLYVRGGYEHAFVDATTQIGFGTSPEIVYGALAESLGTTPEVVRARAALERVRFRRVVAETRTKPRYVSASDLTPSLAKQTVHELASHLAHAVDSTGTYAYSVDAMTGATDGSYNWPRHSGATFFLAQAAGVTHDPIIAAAARRAAKRLRDELLVDCGNERCIAPPDQWADLGSSALALLAFTEIDARGLDTSFRDAALALAKFIRSQQRTDGEFRHFYDRESRAPIDVQVLYYTGEATLALARTHAVMRDEASLEAARRSLAHLGRSWKFFGSRYYYGEEHWTCQAAAEMVGRTDDLSALSFCKQWHKYTRAIQYRPGETAFDAVGGFGVGPLVPPRVTAASSRSEAAGALIAALRTIAPDDHDLPALEAELAEALAFVLRHRIGRDMAHLFATPDAVVGRLPGGDGDFKLRIDYEQHAGSAFVRWLDLHPVAP